MRVLFTSRIDALQRLGGDSIHLRTIAEQMSARGHEICYSLDDCTQPPDIIHHFNIGRPEEGLFAVKKFETAQLIINSIYVDYSATDGVSQSRTRRFVSTLFGSNTIEVIKELARFVKGQRPMPRLSYLLKGHRQSCIELLKRAQFVISASEIERKSLERDFGGNHFTASILYPPIRKEFVEFPVKETLKGKGALCAARIEPLKNQLLIIKAWDDAFGELLIVGDPAPNHLSYFEACKKAALNKQIKFLPKVTDVETMIGLYQTYGLHIMPSSYETTGLSTIECLSVGGQCIVSELPIMKEIFGDRVEYVKPGDLKTLKSTIHKTLQKTGNLQTVNWAKTEFHPVHIVDQIEDLYKSTKG